MKVGMGDVMGIGNVARNVMRMGTGNVMAMGIGNAMGVGNSMDASNKEMACTQFVK